MKNYKINQIVSPAKKLNNMGECYHPLAPNECKGGYIKAHSIQKSGLLKKIQKNNHVYSLDLNYGNLVKNKGAVDFKLISISKISTFMGFCQFHDNATFELIDNTDFNKSQKQAFLYAYRALCKTIFATRNAFEMANKYIELFGESESSARNLEFTASNYSDLLFYKRDYDKCLVEHDFSKIHYLAFVMKNKPNVLFSTSFVPVVDFNGDIIESSIERDILSINSVPYKDNWVYLVSWHEKSAYAASSLFGSLINLGIAQEKYTDYLFRLIITSENIALSPDWWESLTYDQKSSVRKYLMERISLDGYFNYSYLCGGLEGLAKWECDSAFSDTIRE